MTGRQRYDVVVVGGGFFGCSLAAEFGARGQRVLLVEERAGLLERASYNNQARVHHGHHYPRSILTARRSAVNFPRWVEAYRSSVVDDVDACYAIARQGSKVSARQFANTMARVGAPVTPAPERLAHLFNPALIEQAFSVKEFVFDAVKLRDRLVETMAAARIEVLTSTRAHRVDPGHGALVVALEEASERRSVEARHVFNCTYSRINDLLTASDLPRIRLKHELAELCLVDVPPPLKRAGITVMCGPFFSLMPFPALGSHTLSHVRYTPHVAWEDTPEFHRGQADFLAGDRPASNYRFMQADARRFLPLLSELRHTGSLWEIKTVLPRSEEDDSRPILFRRDCGLPNFHCVMGAKIDNIFDVLAECGPEALIAP